MTTLQISEKDGASQYGFGGRLTSEFPSQVVVDLTEVCNLACVHCPHPAFKKSEHYAARYLDPALNAKMADEVRDFGKGRAQYIRYTAEGEPLVHPHAYEMLQYAVENSGTLVTLTTNGTILNEKRLSRLLASGLHMIDVSIDAFTEETYSSIRVNGDLATTRANVRRLIRMTRETGRQTKIAVSYIEQPRNQAETDRFEAFWKREGADYVVVRRMHSGAGAVREAADIIRRECSGMQRRPCLYPWERIILNPRGGLSFCPQDWVHGSEIADYRLTTIREVWTGERYRALRQAHLDNDYSCHSFCGQCPDWSTTRWPSEGRSYADLISELRDRA